MIASGFSLRGLSEVTTTWSARSTAILPISGRLPRSRSPPAPNTTSTRPLGELARGAQHVVERVRRVRVVDEHGEGLPLLDGLEAAGDAFERADAGRDLVLVEVEQDAGGDGAEDVLDVETAVEARLDLDPAGAEASAGGVEHEVVGLDLGVVGEAERDQRRIGPLCRFIYNEIDSS